MDENLKPAAAEEEMSAPERPAAAPARKPFQYPSVRAEDAESITNAIRTKIDDQHTAVSSDLQQYVSRNRSLLSRLFPSELDRMLRDTQLNQAETEGAYQERLLKLATDTKLEAARESTDAWLKSLKVGVRESFFGSISLRYENLQRTVELRREEFGRHMRGRYKTLESYADMPELAERYRASMNDEMGEYLCWIDGLLDKFRSIVSEKIGSYDPALPTRSS